MIIACMIFLVLTSLYLLALRGRNNLRGLDKLRGWYYAHRGLHGNGVPENSMRAFRLALEQGYGVELDVHLMKDGSLAVIHDSSLLRTAGSPVMIEDLITEQLVNYTLEGTQETIPTLQQVLHLFQGKAPLIVELKSFEDNYATLAEAVCKLLDDYEGPYCLESFDPRCIAWLRKNRPQIIRGQLAYNALKDKACPFSYVVKFISTNLLFNFLTFPDFVAYHFPERKMLSVRLARKIWRIQGVAWTIQNDKDFQMACNENWIPIFEGFRP